MTNNDLDTAVDDARILRAKVEQLKKALAESCDENRELVLAEGPWSTDMCPTASRLSAENAKLRERLIHELTCAEGRGLTHEQAVAEVDDDQ